MREQLTEGDVKKIEEEIEYRKLVVRKDAIEAVKEARSHADDEVGLDKTVEVYCEDDDELETYKIVTSVRGNSMNGLISIESPLGKALLGHKVGDRVYIKVNEQFGYYVEIRSISAAASEDEDEIRKF